MSVNLIKVKLFCVLFDLNYKFKLRKNGKYNSCLIIVGDFQ